MRNLRFNLGILSLIVLAVLFAGCSAGPVVKITGVEDGKVYGDAVTPGVAVDPEDAEVTLTLNGNPYDGSPITENGSYTLTAAATAEELPNLSQYLSAFVKVFLIMFSLMISKSLMDTPLKMMRV